MKLRRQALSEFEMLENSVASAGRRTLCFQDEKYFMPIPQREIEKNPDLK
ncbi:RagB/SusD family nutrient uptake outer membrane protein [Dyadobacter sediminis]|uniref:RagB/SusD family nutrient uptake outer membrane protein n=1 Tax=Dyadobacter sediminis TaxID=1493691 RepID=A0A5R9KBG2_9BACT|nr:RagB/SusD family nutrient uptake outer membrane protein [Dyadobacter sediminis]TLU92057.1 RagB/SusD family nutrient uptake outer membrane protein [Dyadobacter sediminis]